MPEYPRFPPYRPRLIEILAFEQVQLLDVAGPLQVFASVNQLAAAEGRAPPYAPRVVVASGPAVTASAGLGLLAAPLPEADASLDTRLDDAGTTKTREGASAATPAGADSLARQNPGVGNTATPFRDGVGCLRPGCPTR